MRCREPIFKGSLAIAAAHLLPFPPKFVSVILAVKMHEVYSGLSNSKPFILFCLNFSNITDSSGRFYTWASFTPEHHLHLTSSERHLQSTSEKLPGRSDVSFRRCPFPWAWPTWGIWQTHQAAGHVLLTCHCHPMLSRGEIYTCERAWVLSKHL